MSTDVAQEPDLENVLMKGGRKDVGADPCVGPYEQGHETGFVYCVFFGQTTPWFGPVTGPRPL